MSRTIVRRTIHAPVESVFQILADIENYSKAVPDIVGVEMLSEVTSGVGARFRETRLMKGFLFKALEKDMDAVKSYCEE